MCDLFVNVFLGVVWFVCLYSCLCLCVFVVECVRALCVVYSVMLWVFDVALLCCGYLLLCV